MTVVIVYYYSRSRYK